MAPTDSEFYPALGNITDITRAQYCVVTFSADHDFTNGEYISLRVSSANGMYQVNNMRGKVLSHDSTTVTLDIDTSNFSPFVYPAVGTVVIPAVAVPAGSGMVPDSAIPHTNLEDAFDNRPV